MQYQKPMTLKRFMGYFDILNCDQLSVRLEVRTFFIRMKFTSIFFHVTPTEQDCTIIETFFLQIHTYPLNSHLSYWSDTYANPPAQSPHYRG